MKEGQRQLVTVVPARRLLLADVGSARVDAEKFDVRVAEFDTLRLRLIKIAACVVEMKTMLRVHLPTSCPGQNILRFALGRILQLVT